MFNSSYKQELISILFEEDYQPKRKMGKRYKQMDHKKKKEMALIIRRCSALVI